MSEVAENRILRVTRWLIYVIMALIAGATVVLSFAAVALPFYWDEASVQIAKEFPALGAAVSLPQLYVIFAVCLFIFGLVWMILRKLIAIVDSVAEGDPFVRANALRLKAIGWLMLAVQIIDISLTGILAVLLVFILAGIFERGAEMREELEGTV
jgi:lysylphosphatidylglycerol synthetase-like protein (DUF2156 family)